MRLIKFLFGAVLGLTVGLWRSADSVDRHQELEGLKRPWVPFAIIGYWTTFVAVLAAFKIRHARLATAIYLGVAAVRVSRRHGNNLRLGQQPRRT